MKECLIVCYGVLVKAGKWDLEPIEGSEKPVVPEEYRTRVALYLVPKPSP